MTGIEQKVGALTKQYNTADPFELCRFLEIFVLTVELPKRLWGFYSNLMDSKMIYLNDTMEEPQRREVCAHELGHAVLHTGLNTMFLSKHTKLAVERYEKEADYFAACLLIPEELLSDSSSGLDTIQALSAYTGVSPKLARLRAEGWRRSNGLETF